jgi:hypothetical protein
MKTYDIEYTEQTPITGNFRLTTPSAYKKEEEDGNTEYFYIEDRDKQLGYPFSVTHITIYSGIVAARGSSNVPYTHKEIAKLCRGAKQITDEEFDFGCQRAIDTLQGMMQGQMTARRVG